jgi:hypothetical protein
VIEGSSLGACTTYLHFDLGASLELKGVYERDLEKHG